MWDICTCLPPALYWAVTDILKNQMNVQDVSETYHLKKTIESKNTQYSKEQFISQKFSDWKNAFCFHEKITVSDRLQRLVKKLTVCQDC